MYGETIYEFVCAYMNVLLCGVWTIHISTYMHTETHETIHPHYTDCSFHNLYLFKIPHLCHLMKWLSSLHHEKCIRWHPNIPSGEKKSHQKFQRKLTRHIHTVELRTNDFVFETFNWRKWRKEKESNQQKEKRARTHTLFQKKREETCGKLFTMALVIQIMVMK